MPRAARRPLDERARARLREAQRLESEAVADVHAASANTESTRAKLEAIIAKHQLAIDDANHQLTRAQAHLVSVSGIQRAALLLEQPVAGLRAAVRSTSGEAGEQPA